MVHYRGEAEEAGNTGGFPDFGTETGALGGGGGKLERTGGSRAAQVKLPAADTGAEEAGDGVRALSEEVARVRGQRRAKGDAALAEETTGGTGTVDLFGCGLNSESTVIAPTNTRPHPSLQSLAAARSILWTTLAERFMVNHPDL